MAGYQQNDASCHASYALHVILFFRLFLVINFIDTMSPTYK